MSGVEVAGLVLGALPLLLAGLQFYAEGISVTKRYWKYREEVKSLLGELQTESTVYENSIRTLLLGIVDAKDVAEFLANPGGDLWKTASFERKLKKRLGTSYDSYLTIIRRIQTTAESFRQKLKLSNSGQPQFSQPQLFKEHYKRLKFSLKKSDYSELMATVRHANTALLRLTFQRQNIEDRHNNDRISIPNFKRINKRAQDFHSILTSGWTCACQSSHAVNLRLEPRMEIDTSDEDEDDEYSKHDPFHVLFHYGHVHSTGPGAETSPWTWDEAKVHVFREHMSPSTAHVGVDCDIHKAKGVRFASKTKRAVAAALKPEPNLQPIRDLCSAIGTLQSPQRDVCLTLLQKEIATQKYGLKIIPAETLPQNTEHWVSSTLRDVLRRGRQFSKRDRVRLAVILASSVLQLYQTKWLNDDWGVDSIYFVERPGLTSYDQPFVLQTPAMNTTSSTSAPRNLGRIIQNQALFALGVALIELWFGETLEELRDAEDEPQDPNDVQGDFITRINTAYRMADELADDAGAKYSDAVRKCLRCDFSRRVYKLDDVQFQKAVFHEVVAKLQESLEFMTGSYGP